MDSLSFENHGFPTDYLCTIQPEYPSSGSPQVISFAPPGATPRGAGVAVRVETVTNRDWFGVFAGGDGSYTGIGACPSRRHLYVISNGLGYVVDASDPSRFDYLSVEPVTHVRAVPEANIVLFADYTSMCALDVNGIKWTSGDIVFDELDIQEIREDTIRVSGYDAISNTAVTRFLSLNSGKLLDLAASE